MPLRPATPEHLTELASRIDVIPEESRSLRQVLEDIGSLVADFSVDVTHPACAAHLHCRPVVAALGAEVLIAGLNQSMDSWDQAPIATHIETKVLAALLQEVGFDLDASCGLFTTGGTQSNLMALLLARNYAGECAGRDIPREGLPLEASRYRILCSAGAHFSIQRSASVLGLGTDAVVTVAESQDGSMSLRSLDSTLKKLVHERLVPICIVATAGTTDRGAVDPIPHVSLRARNHRCWFHVDAAYGAGVLFSHQHRSLLDGLDNADSVSLDFHKLLWQPLPCSTLLVADGSRLSALQHSSAYLNPQDDEDVGMSSLVGTSPLQTSRRFDALKLLVTFQTLGRQAIGNLVDRTFATAQSAAALILQQPRLELYTRPLLGSVVFRYVPKLDAADDVRVNELNARLRRLLLINGEAVVGRTTLDGRVYLKLTVLNPLVDEEALRALIELIVRAGNGEE